MKFFSVNDFSFVGSAQLPDGDFVAVGIAPASELDLVVVGQWRLGPMQLVPYGNGLTVTALRGWRSDTIAGTVASNTPSGRIGGTLVLMLYEKCDPLVPPGPRAAILQSNINVIGGANQVLCLRLPFSGRKQACVAFKCEDTVNTNATCIVRGVKYHTRQQLIGPGGFSTQQPFIEQAATKDLFNGGASIPQSTIDTTETVKLGRIFYVGGGGDLQENFDELEVWTNGAGTIFVDAEVSGERG